MENSDFFNIDFLTPRAKKVLLYAQKEAKRLNHDYIGPEHILLGLIAVNEGVAIEALKLMHINLSMLRLEVEKAIGVGKSIVEQGMLPMTVGVRDLLLQALDEAKNMNFNFVGTEHLLLALLKQNKSVSARILRNLNVDIKELHYSSK